MRLLEETAALNGLPEHHKPTAIRFPIRIDLRDFATWLDKRDPFAI
jgi:hypothetical protein